ncbi:hypothetical protein [Roseateles sp.]|uniref:hypothetical protein n=1 Tax=Roseateles sp. TaxID=1971397 RepID=UPI003D0FE3AB
MSSSQPLSPLVTPSSTALDRPDLEQFARADGGFSAAFIRALAALAAADGFVTLGEYELVSALAARLQDSALGAHAALRALESPLEQKAAFAQLRRASAEAPEAQRRQAFLDARPLLQLQGEQAYKFAQELAQALLLPGEELPRLAESLGPAPSLWKTVSRQSARLFGGRPLLPAAQTAARLSGDVDLALGVGRYLDGASSEQVLQQGMSSSLTVLARRLSEFERGLLAPVPDAGSAAAYSQRVEQLFQQVGQRIAMVEARIAHEKRSFEEDFEELIHDAGNAVELQMLERLRTDDWTEHKVWAEMARSTFAKELERRLDRAARRQEGQLRLLKEELRLFREEFSLVHASVLERPHHSQLRRLMPALQISTRLKNSTESVADLTLGAGAVAAAGSGVAVYALGAAAVLPVIAPVVPLAGGALLVAGLLKWMMDKASRKDEELRHKREAFEAALRERLTAMRADSFAQLDTLGQEFRASANALLRPLLLEAEAARQLPETERRVAQRVLNDTRQALLALGPTAAPEV